ncbi:putative CENPB DNA-binding domain-containing protein 1 [Oratosquilla oratoria]|uniref:putative CENPB DNA-binding domain-containing protein 1 n=1 Tax=Oratosquilla oratoria TaxID=337810 RepID=UPI003F7644CB
MTGKRKNTNSPTGSGPKKQRKAIDLDIKMKVINEHEGGKKVQAIADSHGFSHSTISTILKNKSSIKEMAKLSTGYSALLTRQRKGLVHGMEKMLSVWIDDNIEKNIPVSLGLIQSKALSIFNTLKTREGEGYTETFTASKGWFQRFRTRFSLHNRGVYG